MPNPARQYASRLCKDNLLMTLIFALIAGVFGGGLIGFLTTWITTNNYVDNLGRASRCYVYGGIEGEPFNHVTDCHPDSQTAVINAAGKEFYIKQIIRSPLISFAALFALVLICLLLWVLIKTSNSYGLRSLFTATPNTTNLQAISISPPPSPAAQSTSDDPITAGMTTTPMWQQQPAAAVPMLNIVNADDATDPILDANLDDQQYIQMRNFTPSPT